MRDRPLVVHDRETATKDSEVIPLTAQQSASTKGAPAADPVGRLLRIGEVMREVALSRAQIYRLIKDPDNSFPQPVKIGCASRWSSSEIATWKERLLASRGRDG